MTASIKLIPLAWRERAEPSLKVGRCCWVCGKVGGSGFTLALQLAGYRMVPGQMGYAHSKCMAKAAAEASARARAGR